MYIHQPYELYSDANHDVLQLVRIIIWAIPMLGFLGTVVGITETLGGLDFSDGAAAVVMVGDQRGEPGPAVIATRSSYYPETHDVIGWKVRASGFEIMLSAGVADVIERAGVSPHGVAPS